jgi:hypothetical protein
MNVAFVPVVDPTGNHADALTKKCKVAGRVSCMVSGRAASSFLPVCIS